MRSADESFAIFRGSGDPHALAAVFDVTAEELLKLAAHLADGPAEAEDLVQATFVSAIEGARRFDPSRSVLPWLCGILANHARMARRRARRQLDRRQLTMRASTDPARAAETEELHGTLVTTIDGLPEPYRPVLRLHLLHGLDAREIANSLERPGGTVRSQISRGLEMLRKLLPASLVGGVAVATTATRGLAAIRSEILGSLGRAPVLTASATVPAVVGGFLTMKKLVLAAVAVIGVTLIWVTRDPDSSDLDDRLDGSTLEVAQAKGPVGEAPRAAREVDHTAGAATGSEVRAQPSVGSLQVRVSYATDGAPASDVSVWTSRRSNAPRNHLLPPRVRRTAKDGTVLLDALEPGTLRVHLGRCASDDVEIVAGQRAEVELVVPEGLRLVGTVVDPVRRPVAGALVYARGSEPDVWGRLLGRTNDAGEFDYRDLGAGTQVWAVADGFAASFVHIIEGSPGARASVRLALRAFGVRVSGRVLDSRARPVAGAIVAFAAQDDRVGGLDQSGWQLRIPYPSLVVADARGRFEAKRIAAGNYLVFAHAPKLADHAPARLPIEVAAHQPRAVVIRLPRAATVTGTFRAASGGPVAGARIVVAPAAYVHGIGGYSGFTHHAAVTDDSGRFDVCGVTPGTRELRALPLTPGGRSVRRTIELVAGQRYRWDPVLPGAASLVVRVVDSTGEALVGWGVVARADHSVGDRPRLTDSAGRADFRDLAAKELTITVHTPGADPWASFPVYKRESVTPDGREVVLQVPAERMRTAKIRCRILATDGAPRGSVPVLFASAGWPIQVRSQSAERTGRLVTGPLPPGEYRVVVRPGDAPRVDLGPVTIAPGRDIDLGDVRLPIGGHVVVRLAHAVESASLELRTQGERFALARTQRPGTWRSRPLRRGRYTLWIAGSNIVPYRQPVRVTAGAGLTVEPELSAGFPTKIVIRFPRSIDGGGFANGTLVVRDADAAVVLREWVRGKLQRHELTWKRGLAPGRYTVEFSTRRGVRGKARFEVTGRAGRNQVIVSCF